jgi:hypothetical protein
VAILLGVPAILMAFQRTRPAAVVAFVVIALVLARAWLDS